jgi:DHA1 family tetracycline resistance protein-like MFS transporter
LAKISITAPIWAAAAITLVATLMAWLWLPETVHRASAGTGMPFRNLSAMLRRPGLRRMLWIDFVYWFAFAIFQTTFALFAAHRFGFDASQTGYFFAAFGVLGAVVQGAVIRPIVHRLGDRPTFMLGLACAVVGLVATTFAHTVVLFSIALVPLALGIGFGHPTVSALVSRAGRADEQGRVQGAAVAMESLGRAFGPVWGNAALARYGDAMPYLSAAGCLALTLLLSLTYSVADPDALVG